MPRKKKTTIQDTPIDIIELKEAPKDTYSDDELRLIEEIKFRYENKDNMSQHMDIMETIEEIPFEDIINKLKGISLWNKSFPNKLIHHEFYDGTNKYYAIPMFDIESLRYEANNDKGSPLFSGDTPIATPYYRKEFNKQYIGVIPNYATIDYIRNNEKEIFVGSKGVRILLLCEIPNKIIFPICIWAINCMYDFFIDSDNWNRQWLASYSPTICSEIELKPINSTQIDSHLLQFSYGTNYSPSINPNLDTNTDTEEDEGELNVFRTPQKIYDELDERVYKLTDYKKKLSVLLWKCAHGQKPIGAPLISGQSGCGKTELLNTANKLYKNMVIADGSQITPEGWKGETKFAGYIRELLEKSESLSREWRKTIPILVIDEADKLILRFGGNYDEYNEILINELYKLIEGTIINISHDKEKPQYTDTENICIILAGSFSALLKTTNEGIRNESNSNGQAKNKYVADGNEILNCMPRELKGRIYQPIIVVDDLTEDDYKQIMQIPKYSPLRKIGEPFGIKITATKQAINDIAEKAYSEGTGVRSMNSAVQSHMDEILFENPKANQVHITAEKHVPSSTFKTPHNIFKKLDDSIYGLKEYKKKLSVLLWKCAQGKKPIGCVLISGQSGCGKTELLNEVAKLYGNMLIADGSQITPDGWAGNTKIAGYISTLFDKQESLTPEERKRCPILVIDEADKMLYKDNNNNSSSASSKREIEHQLLKIIEGTLINFGNDKKMEYKKHRAYAYTGDLVIILAGSFSELIENKPKQLLGFNSDKETKSKNKYVPSDEEILNTLSPELRGRTGKVIVVDDLTEDDFVGIMKSNKYSPLKTIGKDFNISITATDGMIRQIAKEAYEKATGVRNMNNAVQKYMDEALFINPNIKHITISENFDPMDYTPKKKSTHQKKQK